MSWIPGSSAIPVSGSYTDAAAVIRLRIFRFGQQLACRISTTLLQHICTALTTAGSCRPEHAFVNCTGAGGVNDEQGGYVDLASTLSISDIVTALNSIVSYLHTAQLCRGVNDRNVFVGEAAFRFHNSATPSSTSAHCSPFTSTTFYSHSNGARSLVRTQLNMQCALDLDVADGELSKVEIFEPSLHHYDCIDFHASKTGVSTICTACTRLRRDVNTARTRRHLAGANVKVTRKLYVADDMSIKLAPSFDNDITLQPVDSPQQPWVTVTVSDNAIKDGIDVEKLTREELRGRLEYAEAANMLLSNKLVKMISTKILEGHGGHGTVRGSFRTSNNGTGWCMR